MFWLIELVWFERKDSSPLVAGFQFRGSTVKGEEPHTAHINGYTVEAKCCSCINNQIWFFQKTAESRKPNVSENLCFGEMTDESL